MATTLGKETPSDIAVYYFDTETGLYYLQSRYYDPQVGRFLNADDSSYLGLSGSLISYNLFCYCENDAVNNNDPSGAFSLSKVLSSIKKYINLDIGWTKLTVKLSKEFSVILGMIALIYRLSSINTSIKNIRDMNKFTNKEFIYTIIASIPYATQILLQNYIIFLDVSSVVAMFTVISTVFNVGYFRCI